MTEVLEVQVAQIQVVEDGQTQIFALGDILLEGDDLVTISDHDILERVARWQDRSIDDFSGYIVSRPETGNILIHKQAVYG